MSRSLRTQPDARYRWIYAIALASVVASPVCADEVGYQDLLTRLGASAPTGAGVQVVQVEAGGTASYCPDATIAEFAGKTFNLMSGASTPAWHPTTVGKMIYGIGIGMAYGVTTVFCYEAANWEQAGYLHLYQGVNSPPALPPGNARVFNHSWVGSTGSAANDNEVLRRADFAMNRDDTIMVSAEKNGAGTTPSNLVTMGYNGISVGLTSGGHSAGVVPATLDGAGRQKPEIVAPGQYTSFSNAIVSSAAALLYQSAVTQPLAADPWARRGFVIKAALLAGAKHRDTWVNDAPTSGSERGVALNPLDSVLGVDTLNIDRSHQILTAGATAASSEPTGGAAMPPLGWSHSDWAANSNNSVVYLHFSLQTTHNTAAFICTWNRTPATSDLVALAPAPPVANLDMTLFKYSQSTLVRITGPTGQGVFSGGNCASRSAAGNVEHLFLRNLEHGDYVLEVRRVDSLPLPATSCTSWIIDKGPLFGDINGDGVVDGSDLGLLMSTWGLPGAGDLNGDGETDGSDLGALLALWENPPAWIMAPK